MAMKEWATVERLTRSSEMSLCPPDSESPVRPHTQEPVLTSRVRVVAVDVGP